MGTEHHGFASKLEHRGGRAVIAPDARRAVLAAADEVHTSHPREAAILGGIVRSSIDVGRIDADFVRRYTHEIIGEFKLVNVDRRMPCAAEIAMVLERFETQYARRLSS